MWLLKSWNKKRTGSIWSHVIRLGSCDWPLPSTWRPLRPIVSLLGRRLGDSPPASDWSSAESRPAESQRNHWWMELSTCTLTEYSKFLLLYYSPPLRRSVTSQINFVCFISSRIKKTVKMLNSFNNKTSYM